MSFTVKQIRNVCLLGHSGSGKTTLVESMLYQTDAIARMGKTPDGNTTSDFDAEEIRRQHLRLHRAHQVQGLPD